MSLRRRHSLDMSDTVDLGLEPIPFTDRVRPEKPRQKTRHSVHSVSWRWPVVMLAIGCLVYYIVHLLDHQLPTVVTLEEAVSKNNVFSGERSRNSLRSLTSMGPRVVGTPGNMVLAPQIITGELEEAKRRAHASQSLLYEVQKGSGAYTLEYNPQFTNVYDGIQNVIAIIEGSSQYYGILLNCHYDSLPTSDGATDDAISCAVMLELIRVLTQSEVRLKHNIIFLFNGAEETTLQGSHMFLKHKWAATAKVAINLEGAGAGGRAMLFQSGPKNAWLFNYYASSVPHPHGLVLGEELFQTGVIPSVTDYAIFKDYGKMPGLDIAFIRNGYVYHSRFDKEVYVPMGSHQHMGDNALALLRVLGNAPELENMRDHTEGRPVYFDYLGWFMVRYSEEAGIAINIIVFLLSILSVVIFMGRMAQWKWLPQSMGIMGKIWNKVFKCCNKNTKDAMECDLISNQLENDFGESAWFPWIELGFALCASFVGMLVGLTITVIMGVFIDGVATLAMPWYSNVWIIFPLFWCPCLAGCGLVPMLVDWWRRKKRSMSLSMTCQLNLVAAQIPWAIILFILTCLEIRSAALVMFPVLFSALANLLIHLTPLYRTVHKWVWVYLVIHIPPVIFQMYVCLLAYVIFLPTMGRSGTSNADLTIGLITAGLVLYLMNFAIPLIGLVRKPALVLGLLLGFGLVMLPISLTTSVGQPYNAGPGDPALQRMWIMHSTRTFYDENQTLKRNVSGFFVVNMDRNSPRTIKLGGRSITSLDKDCDEFLYCGVPLEIMSSIDTLGRSSSWIASTAPVIPTPVTGFTHRETTCTPYPSKCTINLLIRGPIRLTMTLAPREGVTVDSWSLPTIPQPSSTWMGRPSYFIHIARGSDEEDFPFSITLNVLSQASPKLDLGLAGNYIHHDDQRTSEFNNFLYGFADWTQMTAWISSYTAYVF